MAGGAYNESSTARLTPTDISSIKLINLPIVIKRLFLKKEHEYNLALPTLVSKLHW